MKQFQSFLQTFSWYRKFIANFSKISRHLSNLTKNKASWKWSEEEGTAFQTLKQCLVIPPILKQAGFSKPFLIRTDARSLLNPTERNYSTTKRKALAVTPVSSQRFETLAIDLFGSLTESKDGKKWIIIIENCTTKLVELFSLPNPTAKECTITLIEEVLMRWLKSNMIVGSVTLIKREKRFQHIHLKTCLCTIPSAKQRSARKKCKTNATQRRTLRDFNTNVTIILRYIASLDNPGEPLGVYHTSAFTPCNSDRVKTIFPLRERGRPPKFPQTPGSSSGRCRNQRGRM
ncbi:retrovirus-related Pol polyprotein from transposon 17.6 [Trichonephila clavipes]|nr:retrovirus-related Pol polyprotein from transposon 17.6 [Trichonephila clavipes]